MNHASRVELRGPVPHARYARTLPARPAIPRRIPVLSGFAAIAERYDLILCDVWGVLHDGTNAHRGRQRRADPRSAPCPGTGGPAGWCWSRTRRVPGPGVQAILDGFGVPREAYDAILTSGDLTARLIGAHAGRAHPPSRAGARRHRSSTGSTSTLVGRGGRPISSSAPACSTTPARRPRITAGRWRRCGPATCR